jgi:hypothetical protein
VRTRPTQAWSARTRIAAVAIAAAATLLLTGCGAHPVGAPRQGQTVASAEAALRAIPGVEKASITVDSHVNGIQYLWDIETKVTVQPGATIPDPVRLLDYVVATSWSENRAKPTDATITVTITTTPQIDVQAIATQAGFTDLTTDSTPAPTATPTAAPDPDAPGTSTPTAPVQNAAAITTPSTAPTQPTGTPSQDPDLLPFAVFFTKDVAAKFGAWPVSPPKRPSGLVVVN